MNDHLRHIENLDWITLLLLGGLMITAITRHLYPKRFQEFVLLPVTNKYFSIQGKGYEIKHPFNIAFFVVQVIAFSLFIYLSVKVFHPDFIEKKPWIFLQIVTAYSVFVLGKYVLEKIVAHIFDIEALVNGYLFEKLSYLNLLAIFILIINTVFSYIFTPSKTVLVALIGGITIFYAISFISSFKRNRNAILRHFFYFILYLCALEIAPYIILYKSLA